MASVMEIMTPAATAATTTSRARLWLRVRTQVGTHRCGARTAVRDDEGCSQKSRLTTQPKRKQFTAVHAGSEENRRRVGPRLPPTNPLEVLLLQRLLLLIRLAQRARLRVVDELVEALGLLHLALLTAAALATAAAAVATVWTAVWTAVWTVPVASPAVGAASTWRQAS